MQQFILTMLFQIVFSSLTYAGAKREVPIAISGDLSGFRESRQLLNPTGGLIGLLNQIEKFQPAPDGIRLLTGNNLGREVRAALSQAREEEEAISFLDSLARPPSKRYFELRLDRLKDRFRDDQWTPPCEDAESKLKLGYA
ncbi:MAG: hypothetical protein V3T83_16670, partial [Acidobacteriota bacterium]